MQLPIWSSVKHQNCWDRSAPVHDNLQLEPGGAHRIVFPPEQYQINCRHLCWRAVGPGRHVQERSCRFYLQLQIQLQMSVLICNVPVFVENVSATVLNRKVSCTDPNVHLEICSADSTMYGRKRKGSSNGADLGSVWGVAWSGAADSICNLFVLLVSHTVLHEQQLLGRRILARAVNTTRDIVLAIGVGLSKSIASRHMAYMHSSNAKTRKRTSSASNPKEFNSTNALAQHHVAVGSASNSFCECHERPRGGTVESMTVPGSCIAQL